MKFSFTNRPGAPTEAVPGGVYLCQVDATVSCGACCGLYNVADASRPTIEAMLRRRTEGLRHVAREMDAILDFGRRTAERDGHPRPYPDFHHCPYLGLIDGGRRVGCLLHPLADGNRGVDWRGLSEYGGMACRIYFCPATRRLPGRYKRLLRIVLEDWYVYGLVATERHLVGALLAMVEDRLGRRIDPQTVRLRPDRQAALAALLHLKLDWSYRDPHRGHLCHPLFEDDPEARPPVPGLRDSDRERRYGIVLRQLESVFAGPQALADAAGEIDRRLSAALRALSE